MQVQGQALVLRAIPQARISTEAVAVHKITTEVVPLKTTTPTTTMGKAEHMERIYLPTLLVPTMMDINKPGVILVGM